MTLKSIANILHNNDLYSAIMKLFHLKVNNVKEMIKMASHSHQFVERYDGMVGFGLNRQTNEDTLIYYLQKFSDDDLMAVMRSRLDDEDLAGLFDQLSSLLRKHLSEDEYHKYFLKEEH
ncbi:MAG: hypothetical protein PVJ84_08735 [Desulfobacteraceae bacterium]